MTKGESVPNGKTGAVRAHVHPLMSCAAALAAASALAATASAPDDSIGNVGDVKLKGRLGATLDAVIARHVGGTDVDYITACFQEKTERRGWWQTEFWGKYMHSAVPYAVYSGSEKIRADLDRSVDRILATQEPSGYIGNYPDELRCGGGWDVWGMKYTLMGLLHYYDYLKRADPKVSAGADPRAARVLAAARRLCDYVIAEIGPNGRRGRELWQTGSWTGYASSSILEPVVWLYRRTKDGKYLAFADFIVKGMGEPPDGPRLVDLALKGVSVADRGGYGEKSRTHSRGKAYEMMSCYQGLLDYAEEVEKTGGGGEWKNLRAAAIRTAEDIVKEEINLAGGCARVEQWFHGAKMQHLPCRHLQETCVTTTWLRFCEKLLEVTGESKWADEIERTFYNVYLGSIRKDGSEYAAYTPLSGSRWRGHDHCFMHTDCCTANGPRGFLVFLREFFRVTDAAATFNFYSSALVKGTVPKTGARVAFDMYSLYPRDGYARIVSHTDASAGEVPVRFRVPGWCPKMTVRLNGKDCACAPEGGYVTLRRTWALGDIVEVSFEMPVVAHKLGHNVAFTRGPILLARDSRFNDGDMMEAYLAVLKDGQQMGGAFQEVATPSEDIWMAFAAVLPIGSHTENPEAKKPAPVFFCDYASAGNEWRPGNYYRTWFPEEQ